MDSRHSLKRYDVIAFAMGYPAGRKSMQYLIGLLSCPLCSVALPAGVKFSCLSFSCEKLPFPSQLWSMSMFVPVYNSVRNLPPIAAFYKERLVVSILSEPRTALTEIHQRNKNKRRRVVASNSGTSLVRRS